MTVFPSHFCRDLLSSPSPQQCKALPAQGHRGRGIPATGTRTAFAMTSSIVREIEKGCFVTLTLPPTP